MRSRKGGTRVGAKQSATSRKRRKAPSRRRKVRIRPHLAPWAAPTNPSWSGRAAVRQEPGMADDPALLAAYFDRIGYRGEPAPDQQTLIALHRAHRMAVPFENLDIPLGRGIALDPERLFGKLVTGRRGGYCFEQNALFLRMLESIGFEARSLLARVWLMAEATPPRTHTLNLVRLGSEQLIVDVGFGGSFVPPM